MVLTSLELFAGAGGLALGTHAAGFKLLGLVEKDRFAAETLRENSRRVLDIDQTLVLGDDARIIDYKQYLGKLDLLSGGPPCQPFSTAGRNGGHADDRNMFPLFTEAMAATMPKAVLVENVKGLLRKIFTDYFQYVLKRIQFPLHKVKTGENWFDHYQRLLRVKEKDFADDEQYVVTYQLVDSANYGIPQRRERVFISAFRRDLGIEVFQLEPTHSKESLLIAQWITGAYWKRHSITPVDYLGVTDKKLLNRLRQNLYPPNNLLPWRTVRDALSDLPPPVLRGAEAVIPNHVQHPGARVYPGHLGSFYDYPAKALKAGTHGTPGGENLVLEPPNNTPRYFTTREAARLQSFPDEWHFHGTWGACIKQLGNAVPVDLAAKFAAEIHSRLMKNLRQRVREEENEHENSRRYHTTSSNSTSAGRDRIQAVAVRRRAR